MLRVALTDRTGDSQTELIGGDRPLIVPYGHVTEDTALAVEMVPNVVRATVGPWAVNLDVWQWPCRSVNGFGKVPIDRVHRCSSVRKHSFHVGRLVCLELLDQAIVIGVEGLYSIGFTRESEQFLDRQSDQ
ncbi:hypothetical protein SAMN05421809_3645 [Natronorubrum daqingense]|uniref:Uncharacterized protein n=1 Tax=Natronorubrum daqingense TaxID=588898 RepID=A0A1N7G0V5_9EURY|nr:hypothetical protein SAMN05421809_3645 [Natronorubrum daqingense]